MKTIYSKNRILFSLLFTSFILLSCSKGENNGTPITPVDNTFALKGSFVAAAHPTSGVVAVNSNKTKINFNNFKTDNGPDLDIYLVANLSDIKGTFINLGDIKGLNGNYTYDVPVNTDLTVYKYVVVWCVDFNVNFGYAKLEP
ncbi:DM13 domain-containing protein [Aquirufa sp. ROCK-SH2]